MKGLQQALNAIKDRMESFKQEIEVKEDQIKQLTQQEHELRAASSTNFVHSTNLI